MHTSFKQQTLPPSTGVEWPEFLPILPDGEALRDLAETQVALLQAEQALRAQEERIRILEMMVMTDELTGLANRRGFAVALDRELSLARRDTDGGGVLVMIDLDGFKGINDCYGHAAGDAYLCAVAETLQEGVRRSDVVARLGGDEFAILLTRMDEASGARRVARLEKFFSAQSMTWEGRALPLRASFGFAAYNGLGSADGVLHTADVRLYARKAQSDAKTGARSIAAVAAR